jgi:hypothetical protein
MEKSGQGETRAYTQFLSANEPNRRYKRTNLSIRRKSITKCERVGEV